MDGWESSLTVLPSYASLGSEAKDCYEAATDWALNDEECLLAVLDPRMKE